MRRIARYVAGLVALLLLTSGVQGTSRQLHGVSYPEKRAVAQDLLPEPGAAPAKVISRVTYRDGRAGIEVSFEAMKPAILYGGEVTCFVLWAVTREGVAENLGELPVRGSRGTAEFSTAKQSFALMVTAEPFWLVRRPSDLVVLLAGPPRQKDVDWAAFSFSEFAPAPAHERGSLAAAQVEGKLPVELLQARRTHELAAGHEAPVHAADLYGEAEEALNEANDRAERSPRSRAVLEASRRAVALDNEAIQLALRRREALELERQIAERRAEMKRLQERVEESQALAERARREVETLRADALVLGQEKAGLEREMTDLRADLFTMEETLHRLSTEKQQMSSRLEEALSHVAETRQSARGFVVNLPDILFGVNEATLKPEAQVLIAKLAGILLVIPDLQVVIEGHTDALGSPEYNLRLSRRRAESVKDYLAEQGISEERLGAIGLGLAQPVADNETAAGRRRNRRVEILILEEPEPE
jgi:outer membrane protein OmpA-like peptidoglycan-associated protein